MTTQSNQVIVLRDGEGNYYLIGGEAIQAGRVPEDKKQILEQALQESQDVSGFFFDPKFNTAFQTVGQSNVAGASNVFVGGASVLSPQTITQLQGNIANVGSSQR